MSWPVTGPAMKLVDCNILHGFVQACNRPVKFTGLLSFHHNQEEVGLLSVLFCMPTSIRVYYIFLTKILPQCGPVFAVVYKCTYFQCNIKLSQREISILCLCARAHMVPVLSPLIVTMAIWCYACFKHHYLNLKYTSHLWEAGLIVS